MITPAAVPATIRIRLFASYAERLGSELIEVPAEGIRTVGDVLERLRALPNGTVVGPATLVAVNLRHSPAGTAVRAGDEVAVMPPLAGG
ncbi:MAG TPA: MoaD/ThiS family protein [Gemmatimonadales bacterium]|nr:MoaD/ThiS family protein [Gemmatimonadales bacterium]